LYRLGRVRFLRDKAGAEELAAARDALVAAGDPETAAEAGLMLANIAWHEGRSGVLEAVEDARSLVAGRPPSRAQAAVLTEGARYSMLAEENDKAIALGQEGLRLAEQLGLDDLRAGALCNIVTARGNTGDIR